MTSTKIEVASSNLQYMHVEAVSIPLQLYTLVIYVERARFVAAVRECVDERRPYRTHVVRYGGYRCSHYERNGTIIARDGGDYDNTANLLS